MDVLDLKPIWSAREELGKVSDYVTQRASYGDKADTGRYILTGIDVDGDGRIGMASQENETFAFTSELFANDGTSENFRLLGLKTANAANAEKLLIIFAVKIFPVTATAV